MKELTIEEKAKRYDEAIKVAKDSFNYPDYPGFIRADVVFPELKESEDERMRAMAIKAVHAPEAQSCIKSWGINPDDVIAWLEKQGKSDDIIEKSKTEKQRVLVTESDGSANIDWDTRSLEDARRLLECGLKYINTELEKQGEHYE